MKRPTTNHAGHRQPVTLETRRGMLKVSVGSALSALLGPSLHSAFGAETPKAPQGTATAKSVILLWLQGGPSQIDTFDPKESNDPSLAVRYKPMRTTAADLTLASSLPDLARQGKDLAVIRSMRGVDKEHTLAQYYIQTGWRNTGTIEAPALGSIVSHELGAAPETGLPAFVSIGRPGWPTGYFGPAHAPIVVWDPTQPPENLGLAPGVSDEIFRQRLRLLHAVEQGVPTDAPTRHFREGRHGALEFMRSKYRAAFDLSRESARSREDYGDTRFGRGCLLARRLVEAGVRFVQVEQGRHDTHGAHYATYDELLPELDRAMARLIVDLKQRGLLESTVVVTMGEFGRTPRINKKQGRDHWVDGFSIALAGGGFKGGFAYGRTMEKAQDIEENPVSIPDFMATLCHALGIDSHKEYHDRFDRPIKLVDEGEVIRDLLA
jgi:uncharacterized protein (DUF1501 family)